VVPYREKAVVSSLLDHAGGLDAVKVQANERAKKRMTQSGIVSRPHKV
jgi:hypothetical protein